MAAPVRVGFARPSITEDEITDVVEVLRSGWIASGARVARFEQEFAQLVQARHALATSSCTGALHVGFTSLGVRDGEVILPAMTFAATALSAIHAGAKPVLVDVVDDTLSIDPAAVAPKINAATRAVVAMHYGGLPCDLEQLGKLTADAKIALVEDAAHAIGTVWKGRPAGSIGDFAAFSFYANKNMTTIEGGMLTTNRDDVIERARPLRLQGISKDAWKRQVGQSWRYDVVDAGFKYPMSDVQAAMGIRQLSRLAALQTRREEVAAAYRAELRDVPGLRLPPPAPAGSVHGNHLFVVRVEGKAGGGRDHVCDALRDLGIETSVHFVPLHLHPYFQKEWGYKVGDFPVAEQAFDEILSIPMHGGMTMEEADIVISGLREIFGKS